MPWQKKRGKKILKRKGKVQPAMQNNDVGERVDNVRPKGRREDREEISKWPGACEQTKRTCSVGEKKKRELFDLFVRGGRMPALYRGVKNLVKGGTTRSLQDGGEEREEELQGHNRGF